MDRTRASLIGHLAHRGLLELIWILRGLGSGWWGLAGGCGRCLVVGLVGGPGGCPGGWYRGVVLAGIAVPCRGRWVQGPATPPYPTRYPPRCTPTPIPHLPPYHPMHPCRPAVYPVLHCTLCRRPSGPRGAHFRILRSVVLDRADGLHRDY